MFEVQMLIPLADNSGNDFSAEHHQAFADFATELLGGITGLPGVAVGSWANDDGRVFTDRTKVYMVAVSLADGARVIGLARYAASHYKQEAIYVRYLGVSEVVSGGVD